MSHPATPSSSRPVDVVVHGPQPIPSHFFFVWFGRDFPLFAEIAVKSALLHHPQARLSVWVAAELGDAERARLNRIPRVELRDIEIESLLEALVAAPGWKGPAPDVSRLRQIWNTLPTPAARANLVRLLVLFTEGGVYLDTDTLTLRSLEPLFAMGGFCGLEHILWPNSKLRKASLYFWIEGPCLMLTRAALGNVPYGYRFQKRLLPRYATAANNAVLGFAASHPFVQCALQRIMQLDEREWTKRFRLGTHLLQETLQVAEQDPRVNISRLAPARFYPLGPVISSHYFRSYADAAAVSREILTDESYVIHWYASVSDLRSLDAAHIRANVGHSMFATLCASFLDDASVAEKAESSSDAT